MMAPVNMNLKRVIYNVFSNWMTLIVTILVVFFVTPIIINQLGDEAYGIWVVIVSITGYFTVLDFGVNSAIVRYVSKFNELDERVRLNEVYSTAFALFGIIALAITLFTLVFGSFFQTIINAESYSRLYLFAVFSIVGIDLAVKLLFSVIMGTLKGLQRFVEINVISVSILILKNALLVILLTNGYHLITLALVQLTFSTVMFTAQYLLLHYSSRIIKLNRNLIDKGTMRMLYNYSIYSFLISIAIKVMFFTDSIVIGVIMNVSQVTFYAIPAMIMEYLEKIVWAVIGVLIPIISAASARGEEGQNQRLYQIGTRYTFALIAPIIIVLYIVGDDFIALWIGLEYKSKSSSLLYILMVGYIFFLPQLVAHGILKGISRHKYLAYFLCMEAVINLVLSIILGKKFGLTGIALGTAIPLVSFNLLILPWYTCRVLGINYYNYLVDSMLKPFIPSALLIFTLYSLEITVNSYFYILLFSMAVSLTFVIISWVILLEQSHKALILEKLSARLSSRS